MVLWKIIVFLALYLRNGMGAIFVTDPLLQRLVEIKGHGQPCTLHTDRNFISSLLHKAGSKYIQQMSLHDLADLSNSCQNTDELNKRGGFIYPGTKWCGPGNIANSYNDLGIYAEEDKCCREHDHCPNQLEPGQCRRGICNTSPFTQSHCECDSAFRQCLREVNTNTAMIIGSLFFNVVQVTCFRDRRDCPPHMRSNPSYIWFCEEWKFVPSEEFNPGLIINNKTAPIYDVSNAIPMGDSKITKNLNTLYGKDSALGKIMQNGKQSNFLTKLKRFATFSLDSIPDGNLIWRD